MCGRVDQDLRQSALYLDLETKDYAVRFAAQGMPAFFGVYCGQKKSCSIELQKCPRVRIGILSLKLANNKEPDFSVAAQFFWTPRILFVRRSSDISQDALYREDFSFNTDCNPYARNCIVLLEFWPLCHTVLQFLAINQ